MVKKKGFTLLEVLIVIFVLATGIMVVIQGVNRTTSYVSEAAQRTIALHLAKEGIEAVYNIRNTNWRKWPNQKDECWLVADPSASNCDTKLVAARWVLHSKKVDSSNNLQSFYYLVSGTDQSKLGEDSSHSANSQNFKDWLKRGGISYPGESALVEESLQNPHYKYYLPYLEGTGWVSQLDFKAMKALDPNVKDSRKMWEYRRYLTLDAPKKKVESCTEKCAQELMFCSIVFYTAPNQWIVKVCSMMTNFEKSGDEV